MDTITPPARDAAKVLPEHARTHNRALILQTLFHQGAMSRADLSRATGLTRVTVSDLVAALIDDDLVVEGGLRPASGPGKPAVLVDIARDGHRIIGLDLSRSDRFVGAIMTLEGEILTREERPVPAGADASLAAATALARDLAAAADAPVLGIGVGSPGIVDDQGVVLVAPNLEWTGVGLQEEIAHATALPVTVANDADAAVLAEYTLGGAAGDVLLVRIGRGVGSGLLMNGRPIRGSHFAAGEIGHVTVGTDGGPRCACGKTGCLEAWLAVPQLTARIEADPAAREEILRDAGERLGIALAPVIGVLDLADIVLSGPTDLLSGVLLETAALTVRARSLARFHDAVRIGLSPHGEDDVLRGAAVMVLSARLGVS
ncbi:ROK family transcriptional regulator [Microbacterium telephonicum]|uniref:Putative NBD/HSP70 family sugar kinase n=1 Tax=Microbacterium telephonicum TaxID=1714841 RepID=A0A498BVU8_9MICO|nr:ROK family transcriptional regulator [Microbacterium telephonicum]RLK47844.1 putative NBD/HSP70 family sugar kinase [Microbacterium telephonicum]